MNSFGKVVVCLFAVLCFAQASMYKLDSTMVEKIRFDLMKNLLNAQRDLDYEFLSAKHKVILESMKLGKKITKPEATECIQSARLQGEEQLEEKSQEGQECIKEMKDSLESGFPAESEIKEVLMFRNKFRMGLSSCRRSYRLEIKTALNQFSLASKQCLV